MSVIQKLPAEQQKLVVSKVTHKFQEAVEMVNAPVVEPGAGELLIRNHFVGINAADINISAGRYHDHWKANKPPFDIGFEGLGEVVAVGPGVVDYKIGQTVAYMDIKLNGAFAEYTIVSLSTASLLVLPSPKPEFLPLIVSGLSATLCLDKVGEIKAGETVLITAAAGGCGHLAVQWAKKAGCHVIAGCSSDEKLEFLHSLGCDRGINYSKEQLDDILTKEYPGGIDVILETIGGEFLTTALAHLATKGRLLTLGTISSYN